MMTSSRKRTALSSPDSIAEEFSFSKKPRLDSLSTVAFSSLSDDVPVDMHHTDALDFHFGELTQEFVSTPVPGNNMLSTGLESFFSENPVNPLALKDISQVSTAGQKAENNFASDAVPTSPISHESPSSASSDDEQKPVLPKQSTKDDDDSLQKRQADRAARNRESSRRAREKAKNRFRALENDNMNFREEIRRLRMHNEHLIKQLNRIAVMQQSCTICRYNSAMTQQPVCRDPVLRS